MKNRLVKDDSGFSLIELIVAVLIIAIISGGAIMAFGSIFSSQADAAAKSLVSILKETRAQALGMENKDLTGGSTQVYAKLYYQGDTLNVDVCKGDDTNVLHNQRISSVPFKVKFIKVAGASESEAFTMGDTDVVKMYFKKSTGGVAAVGKYNSAGVLQGTLQTGINKLSVFRASNEDNKTDLVLVELTGRCYVDSN
jgi:prepilin-type N-terminal cleavage/methylation domain-containing protein